MKIKVSAGFTGVISVGSYENSRPSYIAAVEFEESDLPVDKVAEICASTQAKLQEVCLNSFKKDETRLMVERIQKEREDMRFYDGLPSVTSILGWDADINIPPGDLVQYAAHGNLYDAQVKHFIATGKWEDVEKVPGTWADLVTVKKGSLRLPVNDWNFPAFLKKYPIEGMEVGVAVKSLRHQFAGTPDIRKCIYNGKKTLADVKRTPDKLKHFPQTAAYIIAEEENGEEPYEQMMLIQASVKTEQGFSKPIVTDEIDQYKAMFLKAREDFRKRYGI